MEQVGKEGAAKSPVKYSNLHLIDGIPALGLSHAKGIKVSFFSFSCDQVLFFSL